MFETLPAPPKLKSGVLRVIPLGGIGEIGRNMTVFEIDGKIYLLYNGNEFGRYGFGLAALEI